jgi:uncharacterized RmlC-like cupin family protein
LAIAQTQRHSERSMSAISVAMLACIPVFELLALATTCCFLPCRRNATPHIGRATHETVKIPDVAQEVTKHDSSTQVATGMARYQTTDRRSVKREPSAKFLIQVHHRRSSMASEKRLASEQVLETLPPIRVVTPAEFDDATAQTPGSLRRAALAPALGVATGMWGGIFTVLPGAQTGIHHHGEQETIAYVLKGESYVRWGKCGEFSAVARAGDFIHLPAWLPHMEVNKSQSESFEWVVVRSTATPIVVNLPDDFWA